MAAVPEMSGLLESASWVAALVSAAAQLAGWSPRSLTDPQNRALNAAIARAATQATRQAVRPVAADLARDRGRCESLADRLGGALLGDSEGRAALLRAVLNPDPADPDPADLDPADPDDAARILTGGRQTWAALAGARRGQVEVAEVARVVDVALWADELPAAVREQLADEAARPGGPLADLAREVRLLERLDRLRGRAAPASLRQQREQLDAYLARVDREAAAPPPHHPPGFDLDRLLQRVRTRDHRPAGGDPFAEPSDRPAAPGAVVPGPGSSKAPGRGSATTAVTASTGEAGRYLPKGGEEPPGGVIAPPEDWPQVRRRLRRVVVLGEPGYGKSWLLKIEARGACRRAQHARQQGAEPEDAKLEVPVWLRLDEVAAALEEAAREPQAGPREPGMLPRALAVAARHRWGLTEELTGWFAARLDRLDCAWVVLLDGLDEVGDPKRRQQLLAALERWRPPPRARVVLTSRETGYPGLPLPRDPGTGEVELVPFDPDDVLRFLRAWCPLPKTLAGQLADRLLAGEALQGLTRVPLLLSFVCLLLWDPPHGAAAAPPPEQHPALLERAARLPTRRAALYGQVLGKLLRRRHRDLAQQDQVAHRVAGDELALAKVAWAFAGGGAAEADPGGGADWAETLPAGRVLAALGDPTDPATARLLDDLSRGDGVLVRAPGPHAEAYRFLHRTFHEYLTARYLASPGADWRAQVARRMWFDADWREVILLLAGLLEEPAALLRLLGDQRDDPFDHALTLALHALGEIPPHRVDAATASTLLRRAASRLTSSTAGSGSGLLEALRRLSSQNHPAAIDVLVALLTDLSRGLEAQVDAAVALRGTTDPAALALLAALVTDPTQHRGVRMAAAAALRGTTDPAALAALTAVAADPGEDAELRAPVTAWGLGNPTDPGVLAALVALVTDPAQDRGVRMTTARQALRGTTDPAALAALAALLADPGEDAELRAAAAGGLGGTTDPAALAALVALVTDPAQNRGVRVAAARALLGTTDPAALAALTAVAADPSEDAELRALAAAALRGTTDPVALGALLTLVTGPDRDFRLRVTALYGLIGATDPATLAALLTLVTEPGGDMEVHVAAAWGLGGTTDPGAVAALAALLADPHRDAETRAAAAWALRGTTDPAALAALAALLAEPGQHVEVYVAAATGLEAAPEPGMCLFVATRALDLVANDESDDRHDDRRHALVRLLAVVVPRAWAVIPLGERDAFRRRLAEAVQ